MCSAWSSSQKPSVLSSTRRVFPLQPRQAAHAHLSLMPFLELADDLGRQESALQRPESGEDRNQSSAPRRSHARPTFARAIIHFVRTRPRASERHVPSLISLYVMDTFVRNSRDRHLSKRTGQRSDRRRLETCCTHRQSKFVIGIPCSYIQIAISCKMWQIGRPYSSTTTTASDKRF